MKNLQGSNFATAAGIIVLFVFTLAAAYLNLDVLATFLVAVLFVCLAAFLWARVSLRGVEIKLPQEDCCAFPGEEPEAQVKVLNNKIVPLMWLKIAVEEGGSGCIAPVGDGGELSEKLLWIMPHQRISYQQRARAVKRGVCRVEKMLLRSGDGFGLSSQSRSVRLASPMRYVVYPELHEVDPTAILNNMTELDTAPSGFYTDVTLVKSTRDYRDGDSFKDINYRLMARTGQVQVNVHEKLTMCRVCFILDLESFVDVSWRDNNGERVKELAVNEDDAERMFSLAASLIVALHEKGVKCSLVVPSYGDNEARIIIPEVREGQVMQLLTALSETDYQAQETALPASDIIDASHSLGQLFMLSRSAQEESCKRLTGQIEELSVFHIVQSGGEEAGLSGKIFEETDFWSK